MKVERRELLSLLEWRALDGTFFPPENGVIYLRVERTFSHSKSPLLIEENSYLPPQRGCEE